MKNIKQDRVKILKLIIIISMVVFLETTITILIIYGQENNKRRLKMVEFDNLPSGAQKNIISAMIKIAIGNEGKEINKLMSKICIDED
jgi:TRAP-type mannitol/chloroaromatic compound transport system permease small subunit